MKKSSCRFWAIILLATFCSIASGQAKKTELIPVTTSSQKALQLYTEAIKAIDNAELSTFSDKLNEAIKIDPNFFMAYYEIALTKLWAKDQPAFHDYATKALSCKTQLSKGELLIKDALTRMDKNTSAVDAGKKLVTLYPNDKESYTNLAFYYSANKDTQGAVNAYKEGLGKADNTASFYNIIGYLQMELKNYPEAEKAFDKYIELVPNHPNPYDSKGDYYMETKDYEKAYDCFMMSHQKNASWGIKKALKAKELLLASQPAAATSPNIIGTWQMVYGNYQGNEAKFSSSLDDPNGSQIKIWTDNHFMCTGRFFDNNAWFDNLASGTYLLKGNHYVENIQYHITKEWVGKKMQMTMELKGDTLIQSWPTDASGVIDPKKCCVEKYIRIE